MLLNFIGYFKKPFFSQIKKPNTYNLYNTGFNQK